MVFLAGVATADFGSGLVHWGADTWGRDDFPVVGQRLLVPFRVHHLNPDDFVRRSFIETNGDIALITIPVVAASGHSVQRSRGAAARGVRVRVLRHRQHDQSDSSVGAHAVAAPADWHAAVLPPLLGRAEHAEHHAHPYDRHYCITTGWCNRPLRRSAFSGGWRPRSLRSPVRGRGTTIGGTKRSSASARASRDALWVSRPRAARASAPRARNDRADVVRLRIRQRPALGSSRHCRFRHRAVPAFPHTSGTVNCVRCIRSSTCGRASTSRWWRRSSLAASAPFSAPTRRWR